ncbi:MAG: DUF4383 domain-containing protein [Gammaproteobacteria bacterium]|nr:DUF4383 domain-containing protein [Gammaproteobacteria bacterium]
MAFGVVFLLIGVLGFVPGITVDADNGNKLLLGIFEVNAVHNLVHLASGVVALLAATSARYARLYFQVFGVVYGLVTVLGFMMSPVLGLIPVNLADNLLHVVIAVAALYLGFFFKQPTDPVAKV